jgi:hypothetical protein
MWIFITAIFLVTVWLFYRRPKQTIKGLAVVLAVGALTLAWLSYQVDESNKRWESEQAATAAELTKIVLKANYDAAKCGGEKPLHVSLGNTGTRTVVAIAWELQAYVPGHSYNLVDSLSRNYLADAILKPNDGISYCYQLPKFNDTVDPALLEFKIVRPDVTFANE